MPAEGTADYEILEDPSRLREAHAVIFHIPTAPDLRRVRKYPGQKWVAWSFESDINYPMLRFAPYMAQFDLTMTYRLDSDVPLVHFGPETRDSLRDPPREKTAEAPAVYFASNAYDRSGRLQYVEELMRFLPIDSFGKSLKNRELPDDRGRETKLATIGRYRFNIAFENSLTQDYVTEKFFDPLLAGCVPVYRGAPNIAEFAPGENCFIDAAAFDGPRELAEYLHWLTGNPAEYAKYLEWKRQPRCSRASSKSWRSPLPIAWNASVSSCAPWGAAGPAADPSGGAGFRRALVSVGRCQRAMVAPHSSGLRSSACREKSQW